MRMKLAGLSMKPGLKGTLQAALLSLMVCGTISGCDNLPVEGTPIYVPMSYRIADDKSFDMAETGAKLYVLAGKCRGIPAGQGLDLLTNKRFIFSIATMLSIYPGLNNTRTVAAAAKQKADAESLPTKIKHLLHIGG